jgi:Ca2+-binding EF-hand superfamily protein
MKRTAIATVAALLAAGAAFAAEAPQFTVIDADKDGFVSREEARTSPDVMEIFARVDANKDNRLSATEYVEVIKLLQS